MGEFSQACTGRLGLQSRRRSAESCASSGVAVALADVVRVRDALWFGWNGEIAPDDQADTVSREGRLATVRSPRTITRAITSAMPTRVVPVFHNRSTWPSSKPASSSGSSRSQAPRRAARADAAPDDIIWVHDYHLIPFAAELESSGAERNRLLSAHSVPAWQTFMAIPEHQELARALAATISSACRRRRTSPIFSTTCQRRVRPHRADGRIRLFDRLFRWQASRSASTWRISPRPSAPAASCRAVPRSLASSASTGSTTPRPAAEVQGLRPFLEKHPQYQRQVVLTQIARRRGPAWKPIPTSASSSSRGRLDQRPFR